IPFFDLGPGRNLESLQRVDLLGDSWERGAARLVAAVLRILNSTSAGIGNTPAVASGEVKRAKGTEKLSAAREKPLHPFGAMFQNQRMRGDISPADTRDWFPCLTLAAIAL